MRSTYTRLIKTAQNFAIDDSTTSTTNLSDSKTFLANETNNTVTDLFQKLRNYKTQPTPRTFSTVADQIYYHNPPGLLAIESVTISVGDENYPLKPIHSQATWDQYQQLDVTSSDVPQYYFPRQYDFGIWPTPSAVYTGTLVGNYLPQRLAVDDYIGGTVAIANNSATLTGTDTTFTAAMVGRWFCETDSAGLPVGNWYRIKTFVSTTELTLETVFEESALSGSTYLIGQSPEIPEELHEFIPYRAAGVYYATVRRDINQAQPLMNYYFTGDYTNPNRGGGIKGGVLGILNRYNNLGRANSQINYLHKQQYDHWRDERWATTLSVAA